MQVFCSQDSCNVVLVHQLAYLDQSTEVLCASKKSIASISACRVACNSNMHATKQFFAQGNRRLAHTKWYVAGRVSHVATSRHNSVVLNKHASAICMFSWLFKLTNSISGTPKNSQSVLAHPIGTSCCCRASSACKTMPQSASQIL